MIAPLPSDEPHRLEALRSMNVLDSSPDPLFERIVHLAAQIMDTPISAVSLVDSHRQWFKAKLGLEVSETPRDVAFCAHAILSHAPLVVEDATKDSRFAENPLVTGDPKFRFYAGAPLISNEGFRLGTLCAIDRKPRRVSQGQIAALQTLSSVAATALGLQKELKAATASLTQSQAETKDRSLFLSSFGHELRTPLNHILGFAQVIENDAMSVVRTFGADCGVD